MLGCKPRIINIKLLYIKLFIYVKQFRVSKQLHILCTQIIVNTNNIIILVSSKSHVDQNSSLLIKYIITFIMYKTLFNLIQQSYITHYRGIAFTSSTNEQMLALILIIVYFYDILSHL